MLWAGYLVQFAGIFLFGWASVRALSNPKTFFLVALAVVCWFVGKFLRRRSGQEL